MRKTSFVVATNSIKHIFENAPKSGVMTCEVEVDKYRVVKNISFYYEDVLVDDSRKKFLEYDNRNKFRAEIKTY